MTKSQDPKDDRSWWPQYKDELERARVEVRNPAMRLLLRLEEPEGQEQLGW